jgi:IclR family acetate operon transcriptional repressor
MIDPAPPQGAQAALRAIRLLKLFSIEKPEMTLAEISRRSGLNKTTTHRLLKALHSESMINRDALTNRYSLGAGLMALGVQALSSNDLRRRARPVLKTLARESGETATLEVPVDESMLILDEVAGNHVVAATGNVGTRWPMHATSTGKAYLAFDNLAIERLCEPLQVLTERTLTGREALHPQLVEIRKRGFAVSVDELEDGYTAVAAIVRGATGEVQGALSIGGPTQRLDRIKRNKLGESLCRAATRLGSDI